MFWLAPSCRNTSPDVNGILTGVDQPLQCYKHKLEQPTRPLTKLTLSCWQRYQFSTPAPRLWMVLWYIPVCYHLEKPPRTCKECLGHGWSIGGLMDALKLVIASYYLWKGLLPPSHGTGKLSAGDCMQTMSSWKYTPVGSSLQFVAKVQQGLLIPTAVPSAHALRGLYHHL